MFVQEIKSYNWYVMKNDLLTVNYYLTLLVPPDFGGASKKCQGQF
jgi:hypothetical protein